MPKVSSTGTVAFKQQVAPPPQLQTKKAEVAAAPVDTLGASPKPAAAVVGGPTAPTRGEMQAYAKNDFQLGGMSRRAIEALLDPDPKIRSRVVASLEQGVELFLSIASEDRAVRLASVLSALNGEMSRVLRKGAGVDRSPGELASMKATIGKETDESIFTAKQLELAGPPDADTLALAMLASNVLSAHKNTNLGVKGIFASSEARQLLETMLTEIVADPTLATGWSDENQVSRDPAAQAKFMRSSVWHEGHRKALVGMMKKLEADSVKARDLPALEAGAARAAGALLDPDPKTRERAVAALQSGVEVFMEITREGLTRPIAMELQSVRNVVLEQMGSALDGAPLKRTRAELDALQSATMAGWRALSTESDPSVAGTPDAAHLALDMMIGNVFIAAKKANVGTDAVFASPEARSVLATMLTEIRADPSLALGWAHAQTDLDDQRSPADIASYDRSAKWNLRHRAAISAALR